MRSSPWFRRWKRRNNYKLPQRMSVKRFIPPQKIMMAIVGMVLVLGMLFIVATGDIFLVKQIVITPQSEMYVSRSEVGVLAKTHVPSSIFMFSANKLEREVISTYPQVKGIAVTRELPDTVQIDYEEYEPVLSIRKLDTWFIIAHDGMVFYSYQNVDAIPEVVPLVSIGDNQLGSSISVGKKIELDTIKWLLSAATFDWPSLGLNLSEVVMEVTGESTRILQTVYINSENRLVIKVTVDQNPGEILQLVEPILGASLRSGKTVIEIDLRFDRPVVRYS